MAETNSGDVESRLVELEKSVSGLVRTQAANSRKLGEVLASLKSSAEMLAEILPLVRRAAPLLDSPMARLAQSPAAAGVLGMLGKGRGRG